VEPMSDLAKLVIKRFPENRNLQLMGLRIPARFHCSRCSTTQRAKLLGGRKGDTSKIGWHPLLLPKALPQANEKKPGK